MIMNMNNKIQCQKCEYEWRPRVERPKECPECKARLTKQFEEK